ncbi:AsmA family protein [Aquibaculum sediminis]|uniref:AsmA family protein n=1 Tax=Aquibaculum sediminis TaxID=3231907 RepID=UPI0034546106
MRLGWIKWALLLVIAVPVAVLVVGYIILTSQDFDEIRRLAENEVQKATGRELQIEGPIDIALSLTPAIRLEGIRFANAPGGGAEDMARAERLEVQVALLPLLQSEIEVQRLVLVDADILLETDAEGRANWDFSQDSADGEEQPAEPASDGGAQGEPQLPRLEAVTIENARVTWRDGRSGESLALTVEEAQISETENSLNLDVSGTYQEIPFALEGQVGAPALILSGADVPVDLEGHLADTAFAVEGLVTAPDENPGADLHISLDGSDLPALSRLAGRDLPDIGAYSLAGRFGYSSDALTFEAVEGSLAESSFQAEGQVAGLNEGAPRVEARVRGEGPALEALASLGGAEAPPLGAWTLDTALVAAPDGITLSDLSAQVGENAVTGQVELALGGDRPRLNARIASDFLDLTALMPEGSEDDGGDDSSGSGEDSPFLIPDTPLPLDALRTLDGEVELQVGRLRLPNELELESIDVLARLSAGDLTLEPRNLSFYEGQLSGQLRLDASQQPPALVSDLTLSGLNLGRLMREREISDSMQGLLDARLDLSGRGNSPRTLASSLNGESELEVGEGVISNRLLAIVGSGLNEIMNPLFGEQDTTSLHCVISQITFEDGVATNRAALIDTSTFSVAGSGRVDLRDESLDMHFDTSSRVPALVSLAIPFNVRDTLKEPRFAPDPLGTAQRAAEMAGIAIAPPAALSAMLGMSESEAESENPCAVALEAAGTEPAETSAPQQQIEDMGRQLQENLPQDLEGAGDEIGRQLRGLFGN